jgi:hypothetical protein
MGQVQPFSRQQNYGYQPSIVFFNVVHGGLLEPQSEDVQPDQRTGTKLHLEERLPTHGPRSNGILLHSPCLAAA